MIPGLVSLVTVTFNHHEVTRILFDSIRKLTYPTLEVIVVDNGSEENPLEQYKRWLPEIKFVRSETNLGYAGGMNLGVQHCQGEFIFMLNNDMELDPEIIENLLYTYDEFPEVGAVSPKVRMYKRRDTLEYAGFQPVSDLTGKNGMIGHHEVDIGQYDLAEETASVHGGAIFIHRNVLDIAGPLPEIYFLYYEELDWSEKLRSQGFKIYYQPKALLYHVFSKSTGVDSPLKTYYLTRNRLLFMRRNRSWGKRVGFLLYFFASAFWKNLFRFGRRGKGDYLRAFLRGILWNLIHKKNHSSGVRS